MEYERPRIERRMKLVTVQIRDTCDTCNEPLERGEQAAYAVGEGRLWHPRCTTAIRN